MTESALYPQHRDYLAARAVADDVIADRKVFSLPTRSAIQHIGFGRGVPAPAMVLPLWDVFGACDGYQIRPDHPRVDQHGRARKFEVPHRFQPRLDVHPRSHPLLADPSIPVWITEGVPKGDALVSAGQLAVVLLGVWNWGGEALADFEYLAPKGRTFYVCFDSDVMLKQPVHQALARLGALLERRGGNVGFVYLPDADHGRKQGVDDFLAAGGTLDQLLAEHVTTELRTFAWERTTDATPPRPRATRRSLGELEATFGSWLERPDLDVLHAVLATVIANRAPGDPVWLLIVGPPSCGKTEILMALAELDEVYVIGKLTEPSLLSGTSQHDRAADATGGVLARLGERGILLNKDFGTVLAMHHDDRARVLQALRDIYDGRYDRDVGVDGGRKLTWSGHVGLIAGCTPAIDQHHAVVAALGDRYVLLRVDLPDGDRQATRALEVDGAERDMRSALAAAALGVLDHVEGHPAPLDTEDRVAVARLAHLAVRCRSMVDRDGYGREIVNVPPPEQPARFAKQLGKLFAALRHLGTPNAWRIVVRCALSSVPAIRLAVLGHLQSSVAPTDTGTIGDALNIPTTAARRALEDLEAHGVVDRYRQGQGKADQWAMSDWTRARWPTVPEKSGARVAPDAHAHDERVRVTPDGSSRVSGNGPDDDWEDL